MDYLLGRDALGQRYVTGYGSDATAHQRTRLFGHDLDPALLSPPPGALAGGANSREHPGFPSDPRLAALPPQCHYLDEPTSETTNDVCIRWNALVERLAHEHRECGALHWGPTLAGDDRVVGLLGYDEVVPEHRRASLGYDLARRLWGRSLEGPANEGFASPRAGALIRGPS